MKFSIFNFQFSIKVHILVVLVGILAVFSSVSVCAQEESKTAIVYFYVDGMNCENCQARVEKNIVFEKGVTDLKCELSSKMVMVSYKKDKTNPEKLAKAFKKIKLPVKEVPVIEDEKKVDAVSDSIKS